MSRKNMNDAKYHWAMLLDVFSIKKLLRGIFYVLLCVLIAIIASVKQIEIEREKWTNIIYEIEQEHFNEMSELKRQYEFGGNISSMELEAEHIAKVLYGTAQHHSTDGQRAVVWCILNRVEHASYPDTVIEVCEQPQQWMGYSEDNPVVEELYNVALDVLKTWYNDGHRPVSPDYIYLSWSSDEIVLRDKFEEKGAHYWRIG